MILHHTQSIERRFLISIAITCFILIIAVIGEWWTEILPVVSFKLQAAGYSNKIKGQRMQHQQMTDS